MLTFTLVLEQQNYYLFYFSPPESYVQTVLQDISHRVAYFLQMMQRGRWHKTLLLLFTIILVSKSILPKLWKCYTLLFDCGQILFGASIHITI